MKVGGEEERRRREHLAQKLDYLPEDYELGWVSRGCDSIIWEGDHTIEASAQVAYWLKHCVVDRKVQGFQSQLQQRYISLPGALSPTPKIE